jgi:hypothetical protein
MRVRAGAESIGFVVCGGEVLRLTGLREDRASLFCKVRFDEVVHAAQQKVRCRARPTWGGT